MRQEPVFSVPFKGKELSGTRAELRCLINDIEESLSRATELCDMKPPVVDHGTLSYDSVQDFFRQAYPDKSLLGSHATQLFKRLLGAAKDNRELDAQCGTCGNTPYVRRCSDNKSHSDHPQRFLINVGSLKKFAPSVVDSNTPPWGFGRSLRNDLKVLVEKLS